MTTFEDGVLPYLTQPISFKGRVNSYWLIVDHIELIKTKYDDQYAFEFRISNTQPPQDHRPKVGPRVQAPLTSLSIPYGKTVYGPILFGYTFTSLNTLEQNKENLCDFVLAQVHDCRYSMKELVFYTILRLAIIVSIIAGAFLMSKL